MKIRFNCPDFYVGFNIYKKILILQQDYPQYFNNNIEIESIFGAFPNMIWNGGTTFQGNIMPNQKKIEDYIQFYYENNIERALTMTNPLLEDTDIYDRYCNMVLKIAENDNNSILISSPVLEEYIRNKYPKFKIKRSIVASKNDVNYIGLLDKYDKIVLPRRKLKDFDFLNLIPFELRGRFEILCNDPCPVNCPYLYKHYNGFAKITLYEDLGNDFTECRQIDRKDPMYHERYNEDQIKFNEIINNYIPLGYNSFKLSGRLNEISIAFSIVPYLFKQEYQLGIARYLLEN